MVSLIEKRISLQDEQTMASLIIADYYEIIKELSTGLLLLDGLKTTSHAELISYIRRNYCNDIILDDLRILRNRIVYEGFQTDADYLQRNKIRFEEIKNILNSKIISKLDDKSA